MNERAARRSRMTSDQTHEEALDARIARILGWYEILRTARDHSEGRCDYLTEMRVREREEEVWQRLLASMNCRSRVAKARFWRDWAEGKHAIGSEVVR